MENVHDHDVLVEGEDGGCVDVMEDHQEEEEEEEEEEEAVDEEAMGSDEEAQESFPHAIFFVKYLCPDESCGGTLAPLPPSQGVASTSMECNVCGQLRTEEEFLEEIEEYRTAP
jgi:SET and MYND domain-containing protein